MEEPTIRPIVSQLRLIVENDRETLAANPREIEPTTSTKRAVTASQCATVAVLCFVNLINYMDRTTVAGILGDIMIDFDIKNDSAGLLQTVFIVSYMIFAPLFGYLGDRYDRRIIMISGIFLWCVNTFVGSFMQSFHWFLIFRALVGVGEASYSTIAPTIISDLFVKDRRSKMLALFYFAIPVGSGLGYITAGQTARFTGNWRFGLRVTPALGIVAIILVLCVVRDPIRGARDGGESRTTSTTWLSDIRALIKNPSFMLCTIGFTCVAFVAGGLSWWGPKFIQLGLQIRSNDLEAVDIDDVSFKFGIIAIAAGLIGVPLGSVMAQKLRARCNNADPLICAIGLLISAPFILLAIIAAKRHTIACYVLVFFGQLGLNLNWAIVGDMLLYVVIPTRRSTAEAFQILIAHALGDASSPYLIGVVSKSLEPVLRNSSSSIAAAAAAAAVAAAALDVNDVTLVRDLSIEFRSLQYALFIPTFLEVLGSIFFFLTAIYIQKDRAIVDLAIAETKNNGQGESTSL